MHFHGGAYILAGGEVAIGEAILMAYHGRIKVISVDYRMPPDHPFPAALEDAVAVWKEVIKTYKPENVGLFGTSAGGGLTLATVHKLKRTGSRPFPEPSPRGPRGRISPRPEIRTSPTITSTA